MNAALVSFASTGQGAFITSAGYIGPKYKVAHDISLLIPEIWSRLRDYENDPIDMIDKGYLEKVPALSYQGKTLPTEYLGFRITRRFAHQFLGRIFTDPVSIFPDDMLKPELQDENQYADSLLNLVEAGKIVASRYFEDGCIDRACPPLKALLEIMARGSWQGKVLTDPEFRKLFEPEAILKSEWYQQRLETRIEVTENYWKGRVEYLEEFLSDHINREASQRLEIQKKLDFSKDALSRLNEKEKAVARIHGCLGTDPSIYK